MICSSNSRQYREGNRFIQEFIDSDENLIINKSWGVAKVVWEFEGNHLKKRYHFDTSNKLKKNSYTGSAIIEWDYDEKDGSTQETHYDENHNLIDNIPNNAAIIKWILKGDFFEQKFYNRDYQLTKDIQTGVAIIHQEKDGTNTVISYYDENKNLCNNKLSKAAKIKSKIIEDRGFVYRDDEYFDNKDQIQYIKKTKYKSRDSEDDLILSESYYDAEGKLSEVQQDIDGENRCISVIHYMYEDFYEEPKKIYFDSHMNKLTNSVYGNTV